MYRWFGGLAPDLVIMTSKEESLGKKKRKEGR
jgi:hypothetical protein